WCIVDDVGDQRANPVAIGLNRFDGGPVIVNIVQIIPTHFVHADSENGFHVRVEALVDESGQQQFVDEKRGGVAVVKDQGVPQRDGLFVPGPVAGQSLEQRFVAVEGGQEVSSQAPPERGSVVIDQLQSVQESIR